MMVPFFSVTLPIWISFSVLCYGLQVEVTLRDSSRLSGKKIKLICVPSPKKLNSKRKQSIRNGRELSINSQKSGRLVSTMRNEIQLPGMMVNSSNGMKCFLVKSEPGIMELVKNRTHRELTSNSPASILAESGNCPPGYRIDQDRCFPCFPGSYTSGQETECFLCPKDFYMDREAADSCWPCPDAKKTLAEGADSVDSCIGLDSSGRADTSHSTIWIVIGIFIIIFLILSWILIIILLTRLYYLRRGRKTAEDKREWVNYSRKNSQAVVQKSSRSLEKETSRKKIQTNQNKRGRKLENIKEESASPNDSDIGYPVDYVDGRKERSPESVCSIKSPAENNYFFINQAVDSKTLEAGLLDRRNRNFGLSEIKRKSNAHSFVTASDSEKDSDSNGKASLTDIKSWASDSSLHDRKTKVEDDSFVERSRKNKSPEEEMSFLVSQVEKPDAHGSGVTQGNDSLTEELNLGNAVQAKAQISNDELKSENKIETIKTYPASEIRLAPIDEKPLLQINSEPLKLNELNLGDKVSKSTETSNSSLVVNEHAQVSETSPPEKILMQKFWSLSSYPPLYIPQFEDNLLLDFESSSIRGSTDRKLEIDFTSDKRTAKRRNVPFKRNSQQNSGSAEEVRITVQPDIKTYPRYESTTLFQNSISNKIQSTAEKNICPLHGISSSTTSIPCHVNLCVEFLT